MITHPFPGLRPFSREEDAIFFGRDDHVDQLLDKLQEAHFVAVVGTSGSGKSSLVRAGLLPALNSGFMAGAGARWTMAELRPGDRPFFRLAAALVRDTEWGHDLLRAREGHDLEPPRMAMPEGNPETHAEVEDIDSADAEGTIGSLEQDLRRGDLALNWRLGVQPLPPGTRLLILVDQFEELFRYQRTAGGDAAAFVALILGAASRVDVYVVITLRAEFLGDCARYPGLPEAINAGLFLTPRLTAEQMADAIQLPARLFEGEVEPELVRRLLAEVKGESDQLPLLQHALMRLWDLNEGTRRLVLADLDALGGLRQALEDHVEEAFSELQPKQRRIAEVLFRSLSERGPEERDTRRPVRLGEVALLADVELGEVSAVVEVFRKPGRSFLMPPAGTPLRQETLLDITHEALIRQWRRLHDWTADEAERAELYQRISAAAERWETGKSALWVDPDLDDALRWREQTQPNSAWAMRYGGDFGAAMAFLNAGRDQRERQHREREAERTRTLRRARATASLAILALVIVTGVAGWGWTERKHAVESEQRRTSDLFDSGLTHAALLSRNGDFAESRRILTKTRELDREIPSARRLARDLLMRFSEILGGAPERTYSHSGSPLSQVDVSPDGRWVGACGERGVLVLFDADSSELVHRLEGHDPAQQIRDCQFDPASGWLASAGNDRRVILWSLPAKGQPPQILRQWWAPDAVMSIAVGPGGRILATGGEDGDIRLWDPQTGMPIRTLKGHGARVSEVTGLNFSPDGTRLASASHDGTARIWNLASGVEVARLAGHEAAVKGVAFSADGRYLATGGDDDRAILWETESGISLRVFSGHRNSVYGLVFAERGGEPQSAPLLVTGSFDRTLRVWDTESAVSLRLLQGHNAAVNGIAVHGTRLYTAGSDGLVHRWDFALPHQRLLEITGEPASAAISPDGRIVALGLADGGLRLYSLPDLEILGSEARAHAEDVQRLAFSPDGSLLASGGFDGKARLWRVLADGALQPLQTLAGHTDAVHAVAFSPDGRLLASAGYDGQIGLFNVTTGQGRFIAATTGQLLSVAFDSTGQFLYLADRDERSIRVWDLRRDPPEVLRDLPASRDLLLWAELDPSSSRIAAVGRDYVVSIIDVVDGKVLQSLPGSENAVFKARFLPGGDQLATVGVDARVRLWDFATESELFALRVPTNQGEPVPLWDFDFRCTPSGCWLALPLTRGKLALYDFGRPAMPNP